MQRTTLLLCCALATSSAVAASDFPPVTADERKLTALEWEKNAPAVVLFKRGEVHVLDEDRNMQVSTFEVQMRIKILNEEGLEYGEWTIEHNEDIRLHRLRGRTVLPDGDIVPLGADAKFASKSTIGDKTYTETKIAFPAVEPGAILDLSYEIRFEGYLLEPWIFQSEVPTLRSEVIYHVPGRLGVKPWARATFNRPMNNDIKRTPRGTLIKLWMDELPAIPDEPFSFPIADVSSVFDLTLIEDHAYQLQLYSDWDSSSDLLEEYWYKKARKKGKQARAKARALVGSEQDARTKAEMLYRFVRDDIGTIPLGGVWLYDESTIDEVLADREGSYAEKGLLLHELLKAVGVDARLVWAGDRFDGLIDVNVAKPSWFDRVMVQVVLDGETFYLDPTNRRNAFGHYGPGTEGTPVVVHAKKPEVVQLPLSPSADNTRRAELDLEVGADGALAGSGKLLLTGHHARRRIDWQGDPEETLDAWTRWLQNGFAGFAVVDVSVNEDRESTKVEVTWSLQQRDEDVLGDEVSIAPSRPLVTENPFALPASRRRTPVLMAFTDVDEASVTVRWPAGFTVDVLPRTMDETNEFGSVKVSIEVDEDARSLRYGRRFEVTKRVALPGKEYYLLRDLYAKAERADAQTVVLIQE